MAARSGPVGIANLYNPFDRRRVAHVVEMVRADILGGDDARALGLMLLPVLAIGLVLSSHIALREPLAVSANGLMQRWSVAIAAPRRNTAMARTPAAVPAIRMAMDREIIASLPAPVLPREAPRIPPSMPASRLASDREIIASLPVPVLPLEVPYIPPADLPRQTALMVPPVPPDVLVPPLRVPPPGATESCPAPAAFQLTRQRTSPVPLATLDDGQSLALGLARAAVAQTAETVIYNARYSRIAYPMGDVPALYGVCTDVVIRAYRSVGIDLQERVHLAKGRTSDPSIDHRRTETLRGFFARFGHTLAVTDRAEDYRPGDIVTYYRPQNRGSTAHIAIVSDIEAPSGRLMVVHNRGWGPQLEDALFVDRITGHYRYDGEAARPASATIVAATTGGKRPPGATQSTLITRVAARPAGAAAKQAR